jgi:hypothetical protein
MNSGNRDGVFGSFDARIKTERAHDFMAANPPCPRCGERVGSYTTYDATREPIARKIIDEGHKPSTLASTGRLIQGTFYGAVGAASTTLLLGVVSVLFPPAAILTIPAAATFFAGGVLSGGARSKAAREFERLFATLNTCRACGYREYALDIEAEASRAPEPPPAPVYICKACQRPARITKYFFGTFAQCVRCKPMRQAEIKNRAALNANFREL